VRGRVRLVWVELASGLISWTVARRQAPSVRLVWMTRPRMLPVVGGELLGREVLGREVPGAGVPGLAGRDGGLRLGRRLRSGPRAGGGLLSLSRPWCW